MVGWSLLMSNVGITTLVNVFSNFVCPSFSLTRLCRYFPSYFGPARALIVFVRWGSTGQLQFGKNKITLKTKTNGVKSIIKQIYIHTNDIFISHTLILTCSVGRYEGSGLGRNPWYPWQQRQVGYFHLERLAWRWQDHLCLFLR